MMRAKSPSLLEKEHGMNEIEMGNHTRFSFSIL